MRKTQVRQLAQDLDIPVAGKGESREICFVPMGTTPASSNCISRGRGPTALRKPPARLSRPVRDSRRARRDSSLHRRPAPRPESRRGRPLYVVRIEPASKKVFVGPDEELLRTSFSVRGLNWIAIAGSREPLRVQVKIRHQFQAGLGGSASRRRIGLGNGRVRTTSAGRRSRTGGRVL